VPDVGTTVRDKVLNRFASAAIIINTDRRELRIGLALHKNDRRTESRQMGLNIQYIIVEIRRRINDPLHLILDQRHDQRGNIGGVNLQKLFNNQGIPGFFTGLINAIQRISNADIAQSANNHTQRVTSPGDQAAGNRVRPEAGAGYKSFDFLSCRGGNIRAVIDNTGNSLNGHTAFFCDVPDCDLIF